jgi:hypothetical protein
MGQTKGFKIEEKDVLITNIKGACYAIGNVGALLTWAEIFQKEHLK